MKTELEYANELIEKHNYKCFECNYDWKAINSAIIDVENTIEALNLIEIQASGNYYCNLLNLIKYYQNVLQILKDKL